MAGDNLFLMRWAKLYSRPTDAEAALEPAVASLGVRYRFQHPMFGLRLFPDFVLPDYRVVIEVDDRSHYTKKKQAADAERTERLNNAGWRVIRCSNEQAEDDPYDIVDKMMAELELPLRTHRITLPEE